MAAKRYDAFVSYGSGDAEWVLVLAGNLVRLGLHVFLDAWELVAGDLIAVQLQRGLAAAEVVVFVVSAESVRRGWVDEEFADAIAGAAAGRQRLIPVLAGEVVLPPMVASRLYIDFRHANDQAVYEAKVRELAAAIRGQPAQARPAPGGAVVPPPATVPTLVASAAQTAPARSDATEGGKVEAILRILAALSSSLAPTTSWSSWTLERWQRESTVLGARLVILEGYLGELPGEDRPAVGGMRQVIRLDSASAKVKGLAHDIQESLTCLQDSSLPSGVRARELSLFTARSANFRRAARQLQQLLQP